MVSDLAKEVNMDIHAGIETPKTTNKPCKLRKARYHLEQSQKRGLKIFLEL